jgi:3-hydroxyisobutyrate dehydrogenase-like beta-hydroxyacid dehydrogenase
MGDDRTTVTVIGLGLMGQALSASFLAAGHTTTLWNRTPAKADQLVGRGAVLAVTPEQAVAVSDLVVVCLSTYDAVHEVLGPLAGALRGKAVVNLTSGSSAQARAMAAWAQEQGAEYLDGAIMTVPAGIGSADSVLFYGGSRSLFKTYEQVLGLLGGRTTHLGTDHGLPALYDVSLLGLMWGTLNSFLHGVAIVETAGVEAEGFLPWAHLWLDSVKGFMTDYAAQIDARDGEYAAHDATLATHFEALRHLVHESEALEVDTGLPRYAQSLLERVIARGHSANSYAAVLEVLRTPESPHTKRAPTGSRP